MSTIARSKASSASDPARHINMRQQKLVDESIKNHLKYNDSSFNGYLKLRQDLLQQNNIIQSMIREANANSGDADNTAQEKQELEEGVTKEDEVHEGESENKQRDQVMEDVEKNGKQTKLDWNSEIIKFEKLRFEVDKKQTVFKLYIQDIKNALAVQSRKNKDGYKSPELVNITKQLDSLIEQETHLQAEIDNIKNVQKPLLDKIASLVNNFNTNITSSTARIIHPALLRNKDEDLENSVQISYNHAVFSKLDIKQMFAGEAGIALDESVSQEVEDILETNNRMFDKLDSVESSDNGSTNLLYKITRSTLHDISTSTDLYEYDILIDKALKDIASSFKENQEIKTKWNSYARKVQQIRDILEEKDADGDVVMD